MKNVSIYWDHSRGVVGLHFLGLRAEEPIGDRSALTDADILRLVDCAARPRERNKMNAVIDDYGMVRLDGHYVGEVSDTASGLRVFEAHVERVGAYEAQSVSLTAEQLAAIARAMEARL